MKIKEINQIGQGLQRLMDVKMSGPLKFKIARNQRLSDSIIEDALKATDSNNDAQAVKEVMEMDVDADFTLFTESELEELEIEPAVIYMLYEIIDESPEEVTDEN